MPKRTSKSVRLGVEALDTRIVPAVDNFISFHSEVSTGSVAVQQETNTSTFGTVFTTGIDWKGIISSEVR